MNAWRSRIFAAVLRAYPREFRDDYGASMAEHVEAEELDGSSFTRTIVEILLTSLAMRAENLWRDVRYAVRMNLKAPLFTLVIVGTIALAVAANTVAFALLNAVLLKPLPFSDSAQLGVVWQRAAQGNGMSFTTLDNKQADELASASKVFESVTYAARGDTVSGPGGAMLNRVEAKGNYFATLGVHPVLGNFINDASHAPQAVISFALWHARFGGNAQVLGQQIKLEGKPYTIVGVAPADMVDPFFGGLQRDDVWTNLPHTAVAQNSDTLLPVFPIVRLRTGQTWQSARADISRVRRMLKSGFMPAMPGSTIDVGPLTDSIFSFARSFLWLVFAAVSGVLLIACANVANLLLARGAVRESEFALRRALGAAPRRLASQVFTETLLLAACGAAIGLILARLLLPAARVAVPGNMPRIQTAAIDVPVMLYVLGLMIAVALITGMLPAYKGGAKSGRRDAAARLRPVLVAVEIGVAFALTAGFAVMLHSFASMTSVPIGFDPHGVYVANLRPNRDSLFSVRLKGPQARAVDGAGIERAIRAIPGVQDASMATGAPFENSFVMRIGLASGWNGQRGGPPLEVMSQQVGASYFNVLHIPIVAGSGFKPVDFTKDTGSVVVNQAFARAYFPRGQVLGRRIRMSPVEWHVVAVVADTRTSYREKPAPTLYMPFNSGFGPYYGVVLRTSREVPNLAADVTKILQRGASGTTSVTLSSLDDLVAQDSSGMRTSMELLGSLALVALILGLCGVYSVVAYGTERRFHEIGIRLAVGARPWDILSLIMRSVLAQCAAGVVLGIVLYALTTQLLSAQLYNTSPLDPLVLVAVIAVIIACASLASLIPASRAAFTRPSATLRYE